MTLKQKILPWLEYDVTLLFRMSPVFGHTAALCASYTHLLWRSYPTITILHLHVHSKIFYCLAPICSSLKALVLGSLFVSVSVVFSRAV